MKIPRLIEGTASVVGTRVAGVETTSGRWTVWSSGATSGKVVVGTISSIVSRATSGRTGIEGTVGIEGTAGIEGMAGIEGTAGMEGMVGIWGRATTGTGGTGRRPDATGIVEGWIGSCFSRTEWFVVTGGATVVLDGSIVEVMIGPARVEDLMSGRGVRVGKAVAAVGREVTALTGRSGNRVPNAFTCCLILGSKFPDDSETAVARSSRTFMAGRATERERE